MKLAAGLALLLLLAACSNDGGGPVTDQRVSLEGLTDGPGQMDISTSDLSTPDTPVPDASVPDASSTQCKASWHPTSCSNCSGQGTTSSCYQNCTPCSDGKTYRAECDSNTGTCKCLIDGVQICTCQSKYPKSSIGCQPEEWGGQICCWNVG